MHITHVSLVHTCAKKCPEQAKNRILSKYTKKWLEVYRDRHSSTTQNANLPERFFWCKIKWKGSVGKKKEKKEIFVFFNIINNDKKNNDKI